MGELLVQPLPAYSCSSDSVPMICMAATPEGRIFAGGQNGGVYEIVYSSRDTWRQKRMYKVGAARACAGSVLGQLRLLSRSCRNGILLHIRGTYTLRY